MCCMKRILFYSLLIGLISLVSYANLRFVNPSASIEPVDVRTFEISNLQNTKPEIVTEWVMQNPEVKAVSVNESKSLIGVTYQYQNLSEEDLLNLVAMNGVLTVSKKVFAKSDKPGCPVHGFLVVWERTLSALRFVK